VTEILDTGEDIIQINFSVDHMESKIRERIFIVGAPRSGTTLLQSLLAAHPSITSFPESQAFEALFKAYQRRWKILVSLGLPTPKAILRIHAFLDEIQHPELKNKFKFKFTIQQYARTFLEILDIVTEKRDKTIWIEKTPQHINCIDYIENLDRDVKFIHIIRNGEDVIASQYDAGIKNTDTLWKSHIDINRCINSWVEDVKKSLHYLPRDNHILVRYENLAMSTETELTQLCEFIGIPFNLSMIQDYRKASESLIMKHEAKWKEKVQKRIEIANGKKFHRLFDDEQKKYILNCIKELNDKLDRMYP
jgi:hypothetical protein